MRDITPLACEGSPSDGIMNYSISDTRDRTACSRVPLGVPGTDVPAGTVDEKNTLRQGGCSAGVDFMTERRGGVGRERSSGMIFKRKGAEDGLGISFVLLHIRGYGVMVGGS